MLSGDHMSADQALACGLAHAVVPKGKGLLEEALRFCRSKFGTDTAPLRISTMPPPAEVDFAQWRARMAKERRGQPAPECIIQCVEAACRCATFLDGVKAEARQFGVVMKSAEARALQHMFFGERAGAKVAGLNAKAAQPVRSLGVIGGGLDVDSGI